MIVKDDINPFRRGDIIYYGWNKDFECEICKMKYQSRLLIRTNKLARIMVKDVEYDLLPIEKPSNPYIIL